MPILDVTTNLVRSKIPRDFAKLTVDLVAKLLEKPKSRVVVVLKSDTTLSYGGDDEIGAVVHLSSIGKINRDSNKAVFAALCPHFEQHLGIKRDKLKLVFHDLKEENVGNLDDLKS